ncbi:DNA replication licensing factor mcm4, partial [Monoraphidium neglectum]
MEQRTPSKTTGGTPFSPQSAKSTGRQKSASKGRRASGPLASLPSNVQSDLPALEDAGEEVAQAAPERATRGARGGAATPSKGGASELPTLREEEESEGAENAGGGAGGAAPRRRMQAARRGAAGSGGGGGGGGDDDDSMDVDGDAGGAGAGNGGGFPAASQGTARTPERSRGGGGEAASHDAAGLTPGAAALRTPLSVPRPEFGRPLGGGRGASSMGPEESGEQRFIWGSKFRTSDMQSRVRRFLVTFYDPTRDAAAAAAGSARQPTYMQLLREMVMDGRFGLNVDMDDVYACDRLLYQVTVDYPTDMILVWDEEATAQAMELVQELGDDAPPLEEAVQVRPFNLRAEHTRAIRDLDPLNLDTLVAVRGMVTRTGTIIPDL